MIDPSEIVIPSAPEMPPTSESDRMLRDIRKFDAEHFGPNSNQQDRAIMLIQLCLVEGLNTRSRIIGMLQKLGLKRGHIANVLKHGDLAATPTGRWHCDDEGIYRSHP